MPSYRPYPPVVAAENQTLTAPSGTTYSINANQQLVVNGKIDKTTGGVDVIGVDANGTFWQKNYNNDWYTQAAPGQPWNYAGKTTPAGLYSPPGQVGVTTPSLDNYQITADHKIQADGVVDNTTGSVTQIVSGGGAAIWQENVNDLWYSKTTPGSPWSAGTYVNPLTGVAPSIWKGGGNNNATNAADWINGVPKAGSAVVMNAGTMNLGGGNLAGTTLTIQPTTTAAPTINMSNGASLTLATAPDSYGPSTVNIHVTSGTATLVDSPSSLLPAVVATVDVEANLQLSGISFGQTTSFTQNGGTFVGSAGEYMNGAIMLNCNLGGSMISFAGSGGQGQPGSIEVTGSIAAGSGITAIANGPPGSGIIIDHAAQDLGSVVLEDGAYLELKNLSNVGSASYANGKLDVFNTAGALAVGVNVNSLSYQSTTGGVLPDPYTLRATPLSFGKDAAGSFYAYQSASGAPAGVTAIPTHT